MLRREAEVLRLVALLRARSPNRAGGISADDWVRGAVQEPAFWVALAEAGVAMTDATDADLRMPSRGFLHSTP